MSTAESETPTQLPELPLGLAAACVAFAAVCGVADLQDRYFLLGSFLAAAVALVVTSVVMKRRHPAAAESGTTH